MSGCGSGHPAFWGYDSSKGPWAEEPGIWRWRWDHWTGKRFAHRRKVMSNEADLLAVDGVGYVMDVRGYWFCGDTRRFGSMGEG